MKAECNSNLLFLYAVNLRMNVRTLNFTLQIHIIMDNFIIFQISIKNPKLRQIVTTSITIKKETQTHAKDCSCQTLIYGQETPVDLNKVL